MNPDKKKRLEQAGWTVGDYGDVFGLTPEDRTAVENRLAAEEVLRRAAAPFTKNRQMRLLLRDSRTVEMRVRPPVTEEEASRIRDSIEALADEASLPMTDCCTGIVRAPTAPSTPIESLLEITLAE